MSTKRILKGVFRRIGWIFLGLLILLLGLVVFLLIKEAITRKNYLAEYPPPGQMVNLGTHSIHLYCVGIGSPTQYK